MKRIESKRASVTVGEQESGEKRAANVSEYRESIGPRVTLANKRPRSGSSLRPCSRHYLASFTAVKRGCRRRIAIVGPTHRYSPKQASVSKLHRARERRQGGSRSLGRGVFSSSSSILDLHTSQAGWPIRRAHDRTVGNLAGGINSTEWKYG